MTASPSLNILTISSATNLSPNTTYFVRIGALYSGTTNYNTTYPSTSTLASPVANLLIYAVGMGSATINWTAMSAGTGTNTCEGYELDASSTNFNGTGVIYSSSTQDPTFSTLTVSGLLGSTTYNFRVGAYNFNNVANFVTVAASTTTFGPGWFSAWTSADTDNTTSIAWGDFNGDGLLDLAAGNWGQAKRVYKNNGSGTFTSVWALGGYGLYRIHRLGGL